MNILLHVYPIFKPKVIIYENIYRIFSNSCAVSNSRAPPFLAGCQYVILALGLADLESLTGVAGLEFHARPVAHGEYIWWRTSDKCPTTRPYGE